MVLSFNECSSILSEILSLSGSLFTSFISGWFILSALLERFGLKDELDKVKETKKVRARQGKYRNNRYRTRKGPLIVYSNEDRPGFKTRLLLVKLVSAIFLG